MCNFKGSSYFHLHQFRVYFSIFPSVRILGIQNFWGPLELDITQAPKSQKSLVSLTVTEETADEYFKSSNNLQSLRRSSLLSAIIAGDTSFNDSTHPKVILSLSVRGMLSRLTLPCVCVCTLVFCLIPLSFGRNFRSKNHFNNLSFFLREV